MAYLIHKVIVDIFFVMLKHPQIRLVSRHLMSFTHNCDKLEELNLG